MIDYTCMLFSVLLFVTTDLLDLSFILISLIENFYFIGNCIQYTSLPHEYAVFHSLNPVTVQT